MGKRKKKAAAVPQQQPLKMRKASPQTPSHGTVSTHSGSQNRLEKEQKPKFVVALTYATKKDVGNNPTLTFWENAYGFCKQFYM